MSSASSGCVMLYLPTRGAAASRRMHGDTRLMGDGQLKRLHYMSVHICPPRNRQSESYSGMARPAHGTKGTALAPVHKALDRRTARLVIPGREAQTTKPRSSSRAGDVGTHRGHRAAVRGFQTRSHPTEEAVLAPYCTNSRPRDTWQHTCRGRWEWQPTTPNLLGLCQHHHI